jgi:chromosome segregation ATPase
MKREFLKGLELADDVIDKIMSASDKEVNGLKAQLHSAESERDGYKSQIEERDEKITTLTESNKDNEELHNQLKDLQEEIKSKDEAAATALLDSKTDYEIQLALQAAGAKNFKTVLPLLNRENISLDDKGVLNGLTAQLETVQKEHDFLFGTTDKAEPVKPTITNPGNPDPNTPPVDQAQAFADAWSLK